MNRIEISGRLTKDPELTKTASGLSKCAFTVAVDKEMSAEKRDAAKAAGDPTADFPQCIAWRHTADYLCQYGRRGFFVIVTGRIQTRKYDNAEGKTVYVTEIVADNVEIPRSKTEDEKPKYDGGPRYGNSVHLEDFDTGDVKIDLGADDLPF